jgi:hypothetical protein
MWQQLLAVCVLTGLLAGCQPRDDSAASASPRPATNPLLVSGTIAPRAGVVIPQTATFEIVLRRTDFEHGIIAIIPLHTVSEWPVSVDVSVKWPNVPDEGQEVDWKASPPVLSVFVRGSVAGRATFMSEPREYTVDDSVKGRIVNLVLFPIME